jgi:hypothetical protein
VAILSGKPKYGSGTAPRRRWHRRLQTSLLVAGLVMLSLPAFSQAEPTEEYEVKAAFLLSFANFVNWPEDPAAASSKNIRLCVLGDDPFGSKLDRLAAGKSVGERTFSLERVQQTMDARRCHILFLSPSLRGKTTAALEDLRGASILTVGETPDFTRNGGIIRMLLLENRVRFEINVDAAERAHLSISAKLLALAQVVHDERKKGGG